jgi:hypothetical protein
MRSWRRTLWAILALPLILLLNAQPERGADRRLAAAVWVVRLLIFIAAISGFFWLVAPFLAVQQQVGLWLALVVFGLLGTLLEVLAVAGVIQVVVLLCWGRRTMATVVSDPSPSEDPRFQFNDQNGQTHVVSGAVVSASRAYGAGQQVPLLYLPGRPETFVVDRFGDKWRVAIFFFVLGLLILLPWSVFTFALRRFITARTAVFGPLIFVAVGGLFAALGLTAAVKGVRFRRRAARTAGVIVESKSRREVWAERARKEGQKLLTELPAGGPGESELWTITVEFADAAGTTRRATTEVSKADGRQVYQVGDQQPILYDPERPWEIQTDAAWNWVGPLVVGVFGSAFVVVGLLLWIVGIC